jgi:thiamine biosynthesis lipoprotein
MEGSAFFTDSTGYFKECYEESITVFHTSNGAFDCSVFPLVEGWGFMQNVETPLNKTKIDSILQFVSSEKDKLHRVNFTDQTIHFTKIDKRFKMDFNAIAQGLAVDKIAEFIESRGHKNYYVEIGGELIVKGRNRSGENWNIGIDVPKVNEQEDGVRRLESILSITNRAIATSGNYRKYYVKSGKKYAHCLDPRTGFPVNHSLLSATVISDKCSTSDAYATVFMVMGLEGTKKFLSSHPKLKLEVYLLYDLTNGKIGRFKSTGMKKYFND